MHNSFKKKLFEKKIFTFIHVLKNINMNNLYSI